MLKKIFAIVLTVHLIFIVSFALPSPTDEFYINDFANVIDDDVERHIYNMSALIDRETTSQLVVVTVTSLDNMTESEYALKLAREWQIGDKENDNGFLMLISTTDRVVRFEVGYGLEGALPDGKCGRIQDEYMMPYLSDNNYSKAVLKGYDQIVAEVCNEYGIDVPKEVAATPMTNEDVDWPSLIWAILILIVLFIIYFKTPPSARRTRFMFFGGFGGPRGFGGGNFGRGGFSGGGGSFGGGGSSRRF